MALSAVSAVPGVTTAFIPGEFTFDGPEEAVSFQVSVDPSVTAPTLPITFIANTSKGASSVTFEFTLDKALVVIQGGANGLIKPTTLHVSVGQTIRFFDYIEIDDDGMGYVNVTVANGLAVSPTLSQNEIWTYAFDKPGTYTFQVSRLGGGDSMGTVIVS